MYLHDLDEIILNVRNPLTRKYVQDAVNSYKAGAYRAAIISVWISICVDIIEKIHELSDMGDKQANSIFEDISRIQSDDVKAMLNKENQLLDIASGDLELISEIEKRQLERIKEERNFCAHPTFSSDGLQYNPLPETARSFIVMSNEILLSKAPIKGKVIISTITSLIERESFPIDEDEAYKILRSDIYLGRVKDTVIRNIIIKIYKCIFIESQRIAADQLERYASSLIALERINSDLYFNILKEKIFSLFSMIEDSKLKRLTILIHRKAISWKKIPSAIKIQLLNIVKDMDFSDLNKHRIFQIAEYLEDFISIINKKIENATWQDQAEIDKIPQTYLLKDYSIDKFLNSGSFNSAYSNGMHYLLPYSEYYSATDVQRILEEIFDNETWGINQILNAGGIEEVLIAFFEKTTERLIGLDQAWYDFFGKLSEYRMSDFLGLREVLIKKNIIIPENFPIEEE